MVKYLKKICSVHTLLRALKLVSIAGVLWGMLVTGYLIGHKEKVQEVRERIAYTFSAAYLYAQSTEAPKRVMDIYHKILRQTNTNGIITEMRFVNDSVENAYAAYDGRVYVTKGLIDKAQNDDELALIIGHELAHVLLGHVKPGNKKDNRLREMHADKLGMFLAMKAGYNPCKAVAVYARWYDSYGSNVVTTSHPGHVQRYMYLQLPQCSK